jgi:hypothetical protein
MPASAALPCAACSSASASSHARRRSGVDVYPRAMPCISSCAARHAGGTRARNAPAPTLRRTCAALRAACSCRRARPPTWSATTPVSTRTHARADTAHALVLSVRAHDAQTRFWRAPPRRHARARARSPASPAAARRVHVTRTRHASAYRHNRRKVVHGVGGERGEALLHLCLVSLLKRRRRRKLCV